MCMRSWVDLFAGVPSSVIIVTLSVMLTVYTLCLDVTLIFAGP